MEAHKSAVGGCDHPLYPHLFRGGVPPLLVTLRFIGALLVLMAFILMVLGFFILAILDAAPVLVMPPLPTQTTGDSTPKMVLMGYLRSILGHLVTLRLHHAATVIVTIVGVTWSSVVVHAATIQEKGEV